MHDIWLFQLNVLGTKIKKTQIFFTPTPNNSGRNPDG